MSCFDIKVKLCVRISLSTSVVADQYSVAQLLRGTTEGLSVRAYEEASMARGHLDYKCSEFTRTIWKCSVCARWLFAADLIILGRPQGISSCLSKGLPFTSCGESCVGAPRRSSRHAKPAPSLPSNVLQQQWTLFLPATGHQLVVKLLPQSTSSDKGTPQLNLAFVSVISPSLEQECN